MGRFSGSGVDRRDAGSGDAVGGGHPPGVGPLAGGRTGQCHARSGPHGATGERCVTIGSERGNQDTAGHLV